MIEPCIIIGSSHAAVQLSMNLRQQGWLNDIIIIGKENHFPYQRPPLSKAFLSTSLLNENGESQNNPLGNYLLKPEAAYKKANIQFKLNTTVTNINKIQKEITLNSGEVLRVGSRISDK